MNGFLIWLLAGFAAPATASAPAPAISSADQGAIGLAVDRGALIYAYDQAAWHGTDDARAKLPDLSASGGWIVDGPANAPELVFYDKDAADPHAVYVADFRDGKLVSSRVIGPSDDRTLSPARKAMIAAVRAAREKLVAAGARACASAPFNVVVLPPSAPGGSTLVYFLTPQTKNEAVPLGGHYRVEVGPDGKAGEMRAFTHSCIDMPARGEVAGVPDGGKLAGGVVTHLLDPVPTEIHVFSSLGARLPLFVGTTQNRRLWAVEGSRIRLVSNDTGK
ncbi:MAG: hypothetical protein JWO81_2080 [Alphaproteobacteria bacterium]|nr:hypothetical protein [Alphaproteobacteria bacterium]